MLLHSGQSSPLSLHPTACQIQSLSDQARMWPLRENRTRPPAPATTELPEASVRERARNRNSVDDSKNTAMLTLGHLQQKSSTAFDLAKSTGFLTLLFFSSVRWSRHGCHPKCRSNTRRSFSPFPKY